MPSSISSASSDTSPSPPHPDSNSLEMDPSHTDLHISIDKDATSDATTPSTSSTQKSASSIRSATSNPSTSKFLTNQISSILKTATRTPKRIADTVQFVAEELGDTIFTIDENSERQILKRQMYASEGSLRQMHKDTEYTQEFFDERHNSFMSPMSPVRERVFDVHDVYAVIDEQQREMMREDKDLAEFSADIGEDGEWVLMPEDFEQDPLEFLIQFQTLQTDEEKRAFLEGFQKSFKNHIRRFNSMTLEHKEKLLKYHRELFPHILSLLSEQDWNKENTHFMLRIAHELLDTDLKNIGLASLLHFWSFLQILNRRIAMDSADKKKRHERMQQEKDSAKAKTTGKSSVTPSKSGQSSGDSKSPSSGKKSPRGATTTPKSAKPTTQPPPEPEYSISPTYLQLLISFMKKFRQILLHAEQEQAQDLEFEKSSSSLYNMINAILISLVMQRDEFIPELHYYMVRHRSRFSAHEVRQILGLFHAKKELGSWVLAFVLHAPHTKSVFAEFFNMAIASKSSITLKDLEFVACLSTKDADVIAEGHDAIYASISELEMHTQHSKWLSFVCCITESLCVEHPSVAYQYVLDLWRGYRSWCVPLSPHDLETASCVLKLSGMIARNIESRHYTQVLISALVNEAQQNAQTRQHRKLQLCFEALSNVVDAKPALRTQVQQEISNSGTLERFSKHPDAAVRQAYASILTDTGHAQNSNHWEQMQQMLEKQRLKMAEMELELGKLRRDMRI